MAKDMVLWKMTNDGWYEPTFVILSNKSAEFKRLRHKGAYKFVEKTKSDALERKVSESLIGYGDL